VISTLTGAGGDTGHLSSVHIEPAGIVTQAAGENIGLISSLRVVEPIITDNLTGSGDITLAATVYIASAPTEGETNAALYVAAGAVDFKGALGVTGVTTLGSRVDHRGGGTSGTLAAQYGPSDHIGGVIFANSDDFCIRTVGDFVMTTNGGNTAGSDEFCLADSKLFLNDSTNANMTTGFTINQGAADNEILCLKSGDVSHSGTDITEADTFATFKKSTATGGGLQIIGFSDTNATTGNSSLELAGFTEDTALDATKSTSSSAAIVMRAGIISSNTYTTPGANENLLVMQAFSTTRFIFDVEGSAHADVEWVAYDKHNDLALLEDLETHLTGGKVTRMFGDVIKHDRQFFEDEKLFHDIRDVGDGKMRGMMNQTKMLMLHSGAIRQVGGRQLALEDCLRGLVEANPTLEGGTEALALLEAN